MRHGNTAAARHAIALVRGISDDHPIVNAELQEIVDSVAFEQGISKEKMIGSDEHLKGEVAAHNTTDGTGASSRGPPTWWECFQGFRRGTSRIGYRTLLGMALQSLQQLTGANYL